MIISKLIMLRNKIKSNKFLRAVAIRCREWRDKRSFTSGKNNQIHCEGIKVKSRIQIKGNNNKIIIHKNALLLNSLVRILGDNCVVSVGMDAYLDGVELWIEDDDNTIKIGDRTFVGHHTHIACTESRKSVSVGSDCMISSHVQLRTGDSHSILNDKGERINPAQDVVVSDHCWIGEGSTILKGTIIERNSIVATKAVVSGYFGPNVLIGGIPAIIIKKDLDWEKERL